MRKAVKSVASIFPSIAVWALIVAFLLPLATVWWRPAIGTPVAIGYAVLIATVTGYHVGLFAAPSLPDLDIPEVARPSIADAQCAELIEMLERNRVIVDRSDPPHLVVAGPAWSTLPEVGKAAIADCVQRRWPEDAEPMQIDIQPQ